MRSTVLFMSALALAGHAVFRSEADEGGEPGAAVAKGAAIRPDLTNYQTAKSASGSTTKHSGDAVAVALVGATLDETYAFVSGVVGIGEDVLREKYGKANVGQQRMFLGNLIRGGIASKEEGKSARIQSAFDAGVSDFRVAIDARQASAAEALASERAAKQKEKDDAKAQKDAQKAADKAANDQAKADAKAAKAAAKAPKAPKEPTQPAE